jgi:hypothetical protein
MYLGAERFEDAASYLARYELYDEAFRIYAEDEERLPVSHCFFSPTVLILTGM